MAKRRGRPSAAQTPAQKSEKLVGSSKNKAGSATAKGSSKIDLSSKTINALKTKLDDFKKNNPKKKNVSINDLKAVYRRGSGAFSTSHRPNMNRAGWAYARVNKFLKKAAGQKVKAAYVQDDDLLKYEDGGKTFNDKELLSKWKKGESIGFTAEAHLKAKGLIPRADGEKRKSEKYMEDGGKTSDLEVVVIQEDSKLENDAYDVIRYGELGNTGKARLALLEDEKLVGAIYVEPAQEYTLDGKQYVDPMFEYKFDIYVKKSKRGKGYSKILLDYMIADFLYNFDDDCDQIRAEVINKELELNLEKNYGFNCDSMNDENITYCYLSREEAKKISKKLKLGKLTMETKYAEGGKVKRKLKAKGGIIDFNKKMKNEYIPTWKEEYVTTERINEMVARNYLYEISQKYYGGVEEIEFANESKNPKNHFQLRMYLGNVSLWTEPFIYVDDNHNVVLKRTKIEVVDNNYETIKSNLKLEQGGEVEGDCYRAAADFCMGKWFAPEQIEFVGTPYLVHAEVKGQGMIEGIRYGHAWIEDDVNVYDFSNNREVILPKELYYILGDVNTTDPKKYQKYTFEEARAKMLETKHYGSWDIETDYAEGGETLADLSNDGEKITCVNCSWQWSTADSDESDKYVCHKCGFDNSLFYNGGMLKPTMTLAQIAEANLMKDYLKPVSIEYLQEQLLKGVEHEMEHTDNEEIATTIALHHLAERPDYYVELEKLNLEEGGELEDVIVENNSPKEIEIAMFLQEEKAEAQDVMTCHDTKIFKAMMCKAKVEIADNRMSNTENPEELNVWQAYKNIWQDCLDRIVTGNLPPAREYKEGGQPCGCGQKYSKGGLAYGNSHDKGGMPMKVSSTGQEIEIEGGEGVINKRSMKSIEKVEFQGKKMTPCEVVSKINQIGGGVKFKCEEVSEIIAEDGNF
jgi:hypothetical protein